MLMLLGYVRLSKGYLWPVGSGNELDLEPPVGATNRKNNPRSSIKPVSAPDSDL